MATDFHGLLSRAVSSLELPTGAARQEIYRRSRRAVAGLQPSPELSPERIAAESAALEEAISRIEAEFAPRVPHPVDAPSAPAGEQEPDPGIRLDRGGLLRSPALYVGLAATVLLVAFAAVYGYQNLVNTRKVGPSTTASMGAARSGSASAARSTGVTDVDPGVDGGSSAASLPVYLHRQPVFYRTTIVPGSIVVEREQRFLYLVQHNNVAQRYGIGVSQECLGQPGMDRVLRKAEWPAWQVPDKRQGASDQGMPGGPGNPLGARALFLEKEPRAIHGTNAPMTIGQVVSRGCIRMVNDDIVDLYGRVPLETRVIIRN